MRTFSQFVVTTLLVCVLWAAAMTQVHADPLQITWTVTDRFRLFSEADLPARERVDASAVWQVEIQEYGIKPPDG